MVQWAIIVGLLITTGAEPANEDPDSLMQAAAQLSQDLGGDLVVVTLSR